MSNLFKSEKNLALVIGIVIVAVSSAALILLMENPSEADSDNVEILAWLAENAEYAEKIYYDADDSSQGYDFVVHYGNGLKVTIHCTEGHDEFEVRELPKNNFVVSCGPANGN